MRPRVPWASSELLRPHGQERRRSSESTLSSTSVTHSARSPFIQNVASRRALGTPSRGSCCVHPIRILLPVRIPKLFHPSTHPRPPRLLRSFLRVRRSCRCERQRVPGLSLDHYSSWQRELEDSDDARWRWIVTAEQSRVEGVNVAAVPQRTIWDRTDAGALVVGHDRPPGPPLGHARPYV